MQADPVWIRSPLLTGVLAFLVAIIPGGIWSALLVANLNTTPAIPWASGVMAVLLWLLWSYLEGKGPPQRTATARGMHLRARRVSPKRFTLAVSAGLLSIASLSGLWIVLFRAVRIAGNQVPDFSQYPIFFVVVTLTMAALVSSIAEEASFRGYFQSVLESRFAPAVAISIQALVMAPGHGSTQGFAWPTMLFYFLVDTMLGTTANLTKSIIPGIAIHSLGLLTFFGLIWPADRNRIPLAQTGPDRWFWIHLTQVVLFGGPAIYVYTHLARLTKAARQRAGD
jgi:membrane protease YdiL (CAAX protease family)